MMTSHAKALKTTRDREMHHALVNLLLPSSMSVVVISSFYVGLHFVV